MTDKVAKLAEEISKLSAGGQMLIKFILGMSNPDSRYEYRIGHDFSDHGEMFLLMKYDKKTKTMEVVDEVWNPKK